MGILNRLIGHSLSAALVWQGEGAFVDRVGRIGGSLLAHSSMPSRFGVFGALDQHHPTAMLLAITGVPQQFLHRVIDGYLVGARRSVLDAKPQVSAFALVVGDERDQFGPVRQCAKRGYSRQAEHRVDFIWREATERDQERRQGELGRQRRRGGAEGPCCDERQTREQQSEEKRESAEKGHCAGLL